MKLLCKLIGHAMRPERRWSRPGDATAIVEVAVTKATGGMFAAMAYARGLRPIETGKVCIRCEARPKQAEVK